MTVTAVILLPTGGHSYGSPQPENSLEALRDLIQRDNTSPLDKLAYVEFDIHVRTF